MNFHALGYEDLGPVVLLISWLTAAMVALDALIDLGALRTLAATFKGRLVRATVGHKVLGFHEVEQRVRRMEVPKAALGLFDRSHRWGLTGGPVDVEGVTLEVVPATVSEVWPDLAVQRALPIEPSLAAPASTTKGALRALRTELAPGSPVWLVGDRAGNVFTAELASTIDPRAWVRTQTLFIAGLIALDLAWVAAGTFVTFWPPVFGRISTFGAASLIGHFLAITPLAVGVRNRCRRPSVGFVNGEQPMPESVVQSAATA